MSEETMMADEFEKWCEDQGYDDPHRELIFSRQEARELFLAGQRSQSPAVEGWRPILKRLTFLARTSGGTAGPDIELMAACEDAERLLAAAPEPPQPSEDDPVGAAEREVGRAVYERISALMDAKPDTPEIRELAYLSDIAQSVEEYGSWDGPEPSAPLPGHDATAAQTEPPQPKPEDVAREQLRRGHAMAREAVARRGYTLDPSIAAARFGSVEHEQQAWDALPMYDDPSPPASELAGREEAIAAAIFGQMLCSEMCDSLAGCGCVEQAAKAVAALVRPPPTDAQLTEAVRVMWETFEEKTWDALTTNPGFPRWLERQKAALLATGWRP